MKNIYKYMIGLLVIVIIMIVYSVRKDMNPTMESQEVKQTPVTIIEDNKLLISPNATDAERAEMEADLKKLSEIKLTPEQQKNLEQTYRYLEAQKKIQTIIDDKGAKIEPKELNALLKEVDWMRENQYVFLSEAHGIKTALLMKVYKDKELEQKLKNLYDETMAIDAEVRRNHNPLDEPSYKEYKNKEASILNEAKNMTSFPNGMTREQYIEKRLNEL